MDYIVLLQNLLFAASACVSPATLTQSGMHCLWLAIVIAILGLKAMAVASPDDTLLFAIHTFTREFNPGDGLPVQQRPVELGVLCKPVCAWRMVPQYLLSACLYNSACESASYRLTDEDYYDRRKT